MSDRETLVKQRKAKRGWLTRAIDRLYSLVMAENSDISIEEIEQGLEEVNRYFNALQVIQESLELYLDDSELISDTDEAEEYVIKVNRVLAQAKRRVNTLSSIQMPVPGPMPFSSPQFVTSMGPVSPHQPVIPADISSNPTPQLPKIEIGKFNGDFSEWPSFEDKFTALIDNTNLPNISKFSYLQSFLTGDAKISIQGLSLTSENYSVALDILRDRFGRKERIIFGHIQNLLNVEFHHSKNIKSLWSVYNQLQINIRSLNNLGVDGANFGLVLTPIIVSRLPADIRLMWARQSHKKEADLEFLMDFLQSELENRERSYSFNTEARERDQRLFKHRDKTPPSVSALTSTSSEDYRLCLFCSGKHKTEKCRTVNSMNLDEVKNKIRNHKLCFICFKRNHVAKRCFSHCQKCGQNHNALFCKPVTSKKGVVVNTPEPAANVTFCRSKLTSKNTVLQTMRVSVNGIHFTAMLDSGADRSFISSRAVKLIRPALHGRENLNVSVFEAKKPSHESMKNVYAVDFDKHTGGKASMVLIEVDTICAPMYRPAIPDDIMSEFNCCSFSEDLHSDGDVTIDILFGQDYFWTIIKAGSIVCGTSGLVAQETIFGTWVLSGTYLNPNTKKKDSNPRQLLCLTDIPQSEFRKLWDLSYLECSHVKPEIQSQVMTQFSESIKYDGQRYEVALPWLETKKSLLQSNEEQARIRLERLDKKLSRDETLKKGYDEVFHSMEANGIIEEIKEEGDLGKNNPKFYLPHRPVVKMSSVSTKIRPVFDASACGPNSLSLNDCMQTGPNLLPLLSDVLMRFRRCRIALSADIEKAFLQISVRPEDRDVHRFLWKIDNKVRVMRILRVPFGNKASPFLLNATVRHHLTQYPKSKTTDELLANMYVDDWLSGGDTVEEVLGLKSEATRIMSEAGMKLCKWSSNSSEVAADSERQFEEKTIEVAESVRVLGMRWNPREDLFTFDCEVIISPDLVVTKRLVLSCIARIFDPLGLISPFIISVKILFQDLWKLGVSWDEEVPDAIARAFHSWIKGLLELNKLSIPRCYVSVSWNNKQKIEFHCFCDSSTLAYGAVIYLKVLELDNSVSVSLVLSKARVCPLRPVTLPRLELLGAVVGSKLLRSVMGSMNVPEDVKYFCWTDSKVVLQWIKSDPTRWKPFVCNRVAQIQELTEPESWFHCRGKENPADCLTRGLTAKEITNKPLWYQGPPWLKNLEGDMNNMESFTPNEECHEEEKQTTDITTCLVGIEPVLDSKRWGEYTKAVRIMAWIRRFVNNATKRKVVRDKDLSVEELEIANTKLLSYIQSLHFPEELQCLSKKENLKKGSVLYKMNPFIGDSGLIRMKCRLQFSELSQDEKYPIILPKCHLTLLLVRREHILLKHAGVTQMMESLRNRYWIIGLRSQAKRVKRFCVRCQRFDSLECIQAIAPLPAERLKRSDVFSICGLDFAGPLYASDEVGKKFYILLFTCCVVRAVHLELCEGLSLGEFMLAYKRFVARRGQPTKILSDNAKTFQAAHKLIANNSAGDTVTWSFNAPRAPWRGGIWERLVRSVKQSLKKTIGNKVLKRSELQTVLTEIESCVNSRPLTYVSDDPQCQEVLTPSHFLLGRSDSHKPDMGKKAPLLSKESLREGHSQLTMQLDKFWEFWYKEYIRNLPLIRSSPVNSVVEENSLVLIREDNCPRLQWPLARVVRLLPGRDGLVRTVELKTAKGTFVRPIQRVHAYELDRDDDFFLGETIKDKSNPNETMIDKVRPVLVTKRGRIVKPTTRLDL